MQRARRGVTRTALIAHEHSPPAAAEHQRGAEPRGPASDDDDVVHVYDRCKSSAIAGSWGVVLDVADFDFNLPDELIAQEPPTDRGGSRLLVMRDDELVHDQFANLVSYLRRGDLLVVNDTRVFPARLLGHRVPSGGAVECLLVRDRGDSTWEALMHPGQRLKPGAAVVFERDGARIHGEVLDRKSTRL